MNFEFTIPAGAAKAAARCRDQAGLLGALAARMDLLNEAAVTEIQLKRFSKSGPESLGIRTNRLSLSIRPSKAVVSGDAVLSTIGSNVKYLGVHEEGYKGTVQVRRHVRQRFAKEKFFGKWRLNRKADVEVGTFMRKMNIPARAPLRRGIEDCREMYRAGLASVASDFYAGKAA
jgi:hypothetical protein